MKPSLSQKVRRSQAILDAEGKKESAILNAEAEKQAMILHADAHKQKMILEAEGQAEAILKVQQAKADGIKLLRDAGADAAVLKLKSLEAFEKVADGQATTILLPAELQGIASLGAALQGDREEDPQPQEPADKPAPEKRMRGLSVGEPTTLA